MAPAQSKSPDLIEQAAQLLVEAARPRKVILFGSAARDEADEGSDVDFLVILREIDGRRSLLVRLLDALRPLRIPADVLVYSEQEVEDWGHLPGTLLFDALTEGRVLYEA